jgi:hypothetical protein
LKYWIKLPFNFGLFRVGKDKFLAKAKNAGSFFRTQAYAGLLSAATKVRYFKTREVTF